MAIAKKVKLKNSKGEVLIPYIGEIGSPHDIGEIFSAPYTAKFTPKGAVPANGKEYRAGAYTDFWNTWVVGGLVETCTYEEFDRQVQEQGFCDVYAVDTVNRNFKVPQIPDGLTLGVEALAKVRGNGKALGLTDGERSGYLMSGGPGSVFLNTDGNNSIPHHRGSYALGRDGWNMGITQDADKSGIVAEPKAKNAQNLKWFCQLASGEINKADLDLNGLRADIANSANKDLSNVTAFEFWNPKTYTPDGKWYQYSNLGNLRMGGKAPQGGTVKVDLPKPYKNTDYIITLTQKGTQTTIYAKTVYEQTTTYFKEATAGAGGAASNECFWITEGEGA